MAVAKMNQVKNNVKATTNKAAAPKSDIKKTTPVTPVKTEVKTEEKKAVIKTEPVKKVVAAVETGEATAAKKTEVKTEVKTAVKKDVKKASAKKKTTAKKGAKRGPKPAAERTVDMLVQFGGKEVSYTELVNRVKDMWKEQGKRETSLKTLHIYVKPEEAKAYYVINEKITGELPY